jgi:hypothetical protein
MFKLIKRLFGGAATPASGDKEFAALNRQAPIKPSEGQTAADGAHPEGFVCRETSCCIRPRAHGLPAAAAASTTSMPKCWCAT